ncbi:phosphoadenosine phosphosulfate reductase [Isoptericola variabilis J7]|nr:phosphoadenosine phosphosulfate reductase [Isoptericola variabilis J7]
MHGPDLFERDAEACCRMRKVEPMRQVLAGYEAWATGLRRGDSVTRREAPLVTWDSSNNLVKINPIAAWSDDDLVSFALRHRLVVNPLLNDGYPSIGCEPCTRRVAPGEDPRAGRWAGLDKVECGLHV